MRKRVMVAASAACLVAVLVPITTAGAATPREQIVQMTGRSGTVVKAGSVRPGATTIGTAQEIPLSAREQAKLRRKAVGPRTPKQPGAAARRAAPQPPVVKSTVAGPPVVQGKTIATGWSAISHLDQRVLNNGNQFSTEPPDTELCASTDHVMEVVNVAVGFYTPTGTELGLIDVNSFFGAPPAFNRTTVQFGPSTGDVKCYFDPGLKRFFFTSFLFDDGDVGLFAPAPPTGQNFIGLAVSKTSDPLGDWWFYLLNGTEASQPGCPCLPDQPLIGADKYGFYISVNQFGPWPPTAATEFRGAAIYAFSKAKLADGTASTLSAFYRPTDGTNLFYSIQPAESPSPKSWDTSNDGVEYFLSSGDFDGVTIEDEIFVWSITGTKSLNTASPSLLLSAVALPSVTYSQPPAALQKAGGDTPLRDCLNVDCFGFGPTDEPYLQLQTNDDRMQQTSFAAGSIWGALNTAAQIDGRLGVASAWFEVKASFADGVLCADMAADGYVAVKGGDLLFPAVAATADGKAVMAYTLAGPGYFPSAAFSILTANKPKAYIVGAGENAQDGFSGYFIFGGDGSSRWGDYSGAQAVGNKVYVATEYITNQPRSSLANWDTHVGVVTP